jgi:hypothetical protein
MPLALLTGSIPEHLAATAAAVGRAGFEVVVWQAPDDADESPADLFDCYVQLPCGPTVPGPLGRMTAARDLVGRIDTLAAVCGRLRPNASIILGVEDGDGSGPAGPATAASDLLAAVALVVLDDLGRSAARIAVLSVVDLCRAPEEGGVAVIRAVQWEMPTPPLVSAP